MNAISIWNKSNLKLFTCQIVDFQRFLLPRSWAQIKLPSLWGLYDCHNPVPLCQTGCSPRLTVLLRIYLYCCSEQYYICQSFYFDNNICQRNYTSLFWAMTWDMIILLRFQLGVSMCMHNMLNVSNSNSALSIHLIYALCNIFRRSKEKIVTYCIRYLPKLFHLLYSLQLSTSKTLTFRNVLLLWWSVNLKFMFVTDEKWIVAGLGSQSQITKILTL